MNLQGQGNIKSAKGNGESDLGGQGEGQSEIRKGQPSILPLVTVNWTGSAVYACMDGVSASKLHSLEELYDSLSGACRIVTEVSFDSYNPTGRLQDINSAANHGHDLRVMQQRRTNRERQRIGLTNLSADKEEEDEFIDAILIFRLVAEGRVQTKKPVMPVIQTETVHRRLEYLRRSGKLKLTNVEVQQMLSPILPFKNLPDIIKSLPFITKVYEASSRSHNREEFNRNMGMYELGFACQRRSDFMRRIWCVTRGCKRKMCKRHNPKAKYWCKGCKSSFRLLRRESRKMFHLFKSHGPGNLKSAKGKSKSDHAA